MSKLKIYKCHREKYSRKEDRQSGVTVIFDRVRESLTEKVTLSKDLRDAKERARLHGYLEERF